LEDEMNNNIEIASSLNRLVEISRDRADGFKTCANNASDPDLKTFFMERTQICEEAVKTLSVEVMHYEGNPNINGSTAGSLHRTWINLKTAFAKKDNLAVLEECVIGESAAVMAYENALKQEMPDSLRALLERLYEGVKRSHERVCQLRDKAKNNPNRA
jgi:uncharacterized protein (TIGR02284 family)